MVKVTITWKNGKPTSFETNDQATVRRYEGYAFTDENIVSVNVTGDAESP